MALHLLYLCLLCTSAFAAIPQLSGYQVIFSDDFNGAKGAAVDHSKWQFQNRRWTANDELEYYRDSTKNLHLSGDGQMYIIPTKENGQWYSGRLESWFHAKAEEGGALIFQAEIWVPNFTGSPSKFAGLWPAFWAKGQNYHDGTPWPQCGEWDIFEVTNKLSNLNQGTLHLSKEPGCNSGSECDDGSHSGRVSYEGGKYHTWAFKVDKRPVDWIQQRLIWYHDGKEFHSVSGRDIGKQATWNALAGKDYYMLLNVAIGGGYAGNPTDKTVGGYDASMRVRYAAIYKSI